MKDLTLKKLRKFNVERCIKHIHPIDGWSPCDWATALGGECGELLNWVKKLRRLDDIVPFNKNKEQILIKEIAKESADILAYLDLLTFRLGIDLEKSYIKKFNEVSDRYNCKIKL